MLYSIRELRARYRMSQDDLAKAVGTSRQTIWNYEVQRQIPRVDYAIKIARALGVQVEQIDWDSNFEK